jgi:hypothetical protein
MGQNFSLALYRAVLVHLQRLALLWRFVLFGVYREGAAQEIVPELPDGISMTEL